jgi:hypothetical protein
MADRPDYHSFIDEDIVFPEQPPTTIETARATSYSVEVGGLGRVHFPRPEDGVLPHTEEEELGDDSSVDENYDVQSITSSIEDQLT